MSFFQVLSIILAVISIISILVNVILGLILKGSRNTAINEHNKDVIDKKIFKKKLAKKKEVYNEKIKNSENIDDYVDIFNDVMRNNNN